MAMVLPEGLCSPCVSQWEGNTESEQPQALTRYTLLRIYLLPFTSSLVSDKLLNPSEGSSPIIKMRVNTISTSGLIWIK